LERRVGCSFTVDLAGCDDLPQLGDVVLITVGRKVKVARDPCEALVTDLLFIGFGEAVVVSPRDARGADRCLLDPKRNLVSMQVMKAQLIE
jgi:hypothetical protein